MQALREFFNVKKQLMTCDGDLGLMRKIPAGISHEASIGNECEHI